MTPPSALARSLRPGSPVTVDVDVARLNAQVAVEGVEGVEGVRARKGPPIKCKLNRNRNGKQDLQNPP